MFLSNDPNIQILTRPFIDSDRRFRNIPLETDVNSTTQFLNWKDVAGRAGTASFVNNARKAGKRFNIQMHSHIGEPYSETLIVRNSEIEINTNKQTNIGLFIT
jgi:uncharacterized sporulation protein YeaH/YhbH (DUF444 family)